MTSRVWLLSRANRCYLAILVAMCFLFGTAVNAAPQRVIPVAAPCILTQNVPNVGIEQFRRPVAFDCREAAQYQSGVVTYGLFRHLDIRNFNPDDPYEFRHSAYQLSDEKLFVRYADGRIVASPTRMMDARRRYSAGLLVFELPVRAVPITDIIMRVDHFAGERGIAENAIIKPRSLGVQDDIQFMCIFALLGGALCALLIYNASLYIVLRYPFVLAHCATSLSVMMFMASWSGAIFVIAPDMTPNTQISIIFLSAALFVCSLVIFMLTFIERGHFSRIGALPIFCAVVCLASVVAGPLMYGYVPNALSNVFYIGLLGCLLSMLACAFSAWRAGSRPAGYYLFVWSLPISFGIVRVLWGFGLFHINNVIAESSPSFIMVIEALMSALAVTWRIGQLRNERDQARALQRELKHLAETDSLTGLLNRRAFLEQSREGEMLKQFILIDIDEFKSINDRFGHDVGDKVIVAVANIIVEHAPGNYLVGRMGGEEFGVIIRDIAPFLAQRICQAISEIDLGIGTRVTASAGVAIGRINSAEDWHSVYTAADRALYEAKRGGRNRVCESNALAA